jgi:hypothetical protein
MGETMNIPVFVFRNSRLCGKAAASIHEYLSSGE